MTGAPGAAEQADQAGQAGGGGATAAHLGQVARGGAVGLAGSAFAAACGLASTVLVARGLAAGEAGIFFAATALFTTLAVVSALGTDSGLARFLLRLEAEGRTDDVRRAVRTAGLPVVVVALAVTAALLLLAEPLSSVLGLGEDGTRVIRAVAPALPCCVLADLMLAATRAVGQMHQTALVDRVLRAGVQVVAVAAAVAAEGGPAVLGLAWSAAYLLSLLLAAAALRSCLRSRPAGPAGARAETSAGAASLAAEFWSFTWPRGVAGLAQVVVQKADIILVAALLTPGHAALYTAATRFVAVGQLANQAVHQVLQARFTVLLIGEDGAALRRTFAITTGWAVLLVWPLYLVVGTGAPTYLSVFGADYVTTGALATVAVMAATMLLAVGSGPVDTLLLMAGRSGLSMVNGLLALAVDVVACLVLVPRMGIVGAAVAWALALAVRSGLGIWQVRRAVDLGRLRSAWGVPALAAGVAVACFGVPGLLVALLLGSSPLGVLLTAALGAVAYVAALAALGERLALDIAVAALRRTRTATTHPTRPHDPAATRPHQPPSKESDDPCLLET
ncbi:polysaccharide biosynthesis C-terminal domain-containing protein [Nocardioides marmotae]|uniref:oligosaccharide flippase family protein n=1 Tax=Nocardioides marmotae TaxID=2663857 RepID=UPI0012B65A81|nr:lipopolysaccharide biosynthesis protein [Nocardioides marmotae]MBC9733452.1 lipopolysaccharide biosynthesis protein [Nocardioides marmotae]MTB84559.1 oligosaccharide flippase family protein [Nocardioides marmotae]